MTVGKRKYLLQVIDYVAGKQSHVCRGVWSSELHNQCDMIEMSAIVSGFTLETIRGPQTGESLRRAIATGDLPMPVEALTDSYSIFSYLAAAHLKLPAEKSTYYHLAFLREKLVTHFISSYNWVDTRDMVADGLTKGSADRSLLAALMDGSYNLAHPVHEYREPATTATTMSNTLRPSSSSSGLNYVMCGTLAEVAQPPRPLLHAWLSAHMIFPTFMSRQNVSRYVR